MSDIQRHRSGPGLIREYPVDASVAMEIGDLCFVDTDDVKPAGYIPLGTTAALTQDAFHDLFIGVAASAHDANDTKVTKARIITPSPDDVFEFDCVSAAYNIGTLVGISTTGASLPQPQKLTSVGSEGTAVGYVDGQYPAGTTKIMVRLFPTKLGGGPQTPS